MELQERETPDASIAKTQIVTQGEPGKTDNRKDETKM
jgi:hypothetical protein